MDLKRFVRSLSPPVLIYALRGLRTALGTPEWECREGLWNRSLAGQGWEDDSVRATLLSRWPAFVARVSGKGPLVGASDLHNSVMVFAYSIARAAVVHNPLSWLDWGGGLGHYHVLGRALLPEITIEYHCRDTGLLVAEGRKLLADAHFYDDDSVCLARRYDFVMASASLHYREDWPALLAGLASATRGLLLVTRLPIVQRAGSFVAIQRPHRHGYFTQYQGWVINRSEFLDRARGLGLSLEREFLIDERPHIKRAPEQCQYRGFLLRPSGST